MYELKEGYHGDNASFTTRTRRRSGKWVEGVGSDLLAGETAVNAAADKRIDEIGG